MLVFEKENHKTALAEGHLIAQGLQLDPCKIESKLDAALPLMDFSVEDNCPAFVLMAHEKAHKRLLRHLSCLEKQTGHLVPQVPRDVQVFAFES